MRTYGIGDKSVTAAKLGYAPDSTVIVQRGATDIISAANLRAAYTAAKALEPGGAPVGNGFHVTGDISPDLTGYFFENGTYGGLPAYERQDGGAWLWFDGDYYCLTQGKGDAVDGTFVNIDATVVPGSYSATPDYSGSSTVTAFTNRAAVIIPTGIYDFGLGDVADDNHGLEVDAECVDLIGETGQREDVVLTSAIATASRGTVEQTADDVKLRGFTMEITSASSDGTLGTEASAYFPDTALANAELTDIECKSTNSGVKSMRTHIEYAGTTVGGNTGGYTNVKSGDNSFGRGGTASGTFTDCTGGLGSFGGNCGTASGTFTDCTGGTFSFGEAASGTFIDCTGDTGSFGGGMDGIVDAGAVFIRCHGSGVAARIYAGTVRDCYDDSWERFDNGTTAHISNAAENLADVMTKFNTLLSQLESYGILAASQ